MSEMDPRLVHGIELFNKKEFFDCHEILEELWKNQTEPEKQLTQGLIQIAVAYYHALRGNRLGADKLLKRGLARVRPFLPEFRNLLLDEFIASVEKDAETVSSGAELSLLLLPQIRQRL